MIVQLRVLCQLLPQSIHCSRLSQHEQVVPLLKFRFQVLSEARKPNVWCIFLFIKTTFHLFLQLAQHVNINLADLAPKLLIRGRSTIVWKSHKEWVDVIPKVTAGTQVTINFPPFPEFLQMIKTRNNFVRHNAKSIS